jgi:hypothetical protein
VHSSCEIRRIEVIVTCDAHECKEAVATSIGQGGAEELWV